MAPFREVYKILLQQLPSRSFKPSPIVRRTKEPRECRRVLISSDVNMCARSNSGSHVCQLTIAAARQHFLYPVSWRKNSRERCSSMFSWRFRKKEEARHEPRAARTNHLFPIERTGSLSTRFRRIIILIPRNVRGVSFRGVV